MESKKIIGLRKILDLTGLSKSTIGRLEKLKKFPRKVMLTERRVGWREVDVSKWLLSRQSKGE